MSTISMDRAHREVDHVKGQSGVRWIGAIGVFIVIVGALVLHTFTRVNVKDLFVDPAAKGNLAAHVGFMSHIGVLLLFAALVALGASVGIDLGHVIVENWVEASPDRATAVAVLEDLFKPAGIMALAVYAGHVARDRLQRAMIHD